jgi:hypothetical protein
MTKSLFSILKITEKFDPELDPDPDPLVKGTDPRIRVPHQNVRDLRHCARSRFCNCINKEVMRIRIH